MNLRSIIEDMDLHTSVSEMLAEALKAGLIESTGYRDGEETFALTRSGRKLVETSDMHLYTKAYDETEIESDFDRPIE